MICSMFLFEKVKSIIYDRVIPCQGGQKKPNVYLNIQTYQISCILRESLTFELNSQTHSRIATFLEIFTHCSYVSFSGFKFQKFLFITSKNLQRHSIFYYLLFGVSKKILKSSFPFDPILRKCIWVSDAWNAAIPCI